jgi:hypothetical protein
MPSGIATSSAGSEKTLLKNPAWKPKNKNPVMVINKIVNITVLFIELYKYIFN